MAKAITLNLVVGVLLFMTAGCVEKQDAATSSTKTEQVRSAIQQQNEKFVETFQNGNMDAFSTVFIDESGKMMPPNHDSITGREAIMKYMKAMKGNGVTRFELTTKELYPYSGHAIEIGQYTMFMDDTTKMDGGKYMTYWKRSDGQWRVYRNIWNSNN